MASKWRTPWITRTGERITKDPDLEELAEIGIPARPTTTPEEPIIEQLRESLRYLPKELLFVELTSQLPLPPAIDAAYHRFRGSRGQFRICISSGNVGAC